MEDTKELVILGNDGKEIKCDVLFTFDSKETNKSYIVYTDNSLDEEGHIKVFASIYNPKEEKGKLEEITTDREWEVIETMISKFSEDEEEN